MVCVSAEFEGHAHGNDTHSFCPDMFADVTNSAEHYGDNADVGITVPLR